MKAVCFVDKGRVAVEDRPRPSIQDATDAVVRITKTAICGSDLHFYHGRTPMAPERTREANGQAPPAPPACSNGGAG